jgi:hypothetical protein
MDRLLSKQEKEQFRVLEKEGTNDIDNMLQSQRAKDDKWWLAELHSKCPHKKIGEKRSCNACMYLFEKEIGL